MYTIGTLAELSGVQSSTIRYYERVGLIPKPKRQDNKYRKYSEEDLARLNFIRHCRHHNLPVDAIKTLLTLNDAPDSNCALVNDIIDKQIERLDELSKSIHSLMDHLIALRNKCGGLGTVSQCGIMKGLKDDSLDDANTPSEGSPRIIWPEQDERNEKKSHKKKP
jgi:DNA-binding transcriptional MerR regulator